MSSNDFVEITISKPTCQAAHVPLLHLFLLERIPLEDSSSTADSLLVFCTLSRKHTHDCYKPPPLYRPTDNTSYSSNRNMVYQFSGWRWPLSETQPGISTCPNSFYVSTTKSFRKDVTDMQYKLPSIQTHQRPSSGGCGGLCFS